MWLRQLTLASIVIISPHVVMADKLPQPERDKIEQLITFVEKMTEAKFVRNGQEYDAKTAAKFIRGKWQANENQIKSAKDFIKHAASVSSTSGKPYLIRFSDGKEQQSAEYLSAELARIEKR